MSEFYQAVRRAVHVDWDPIGIASLIDEMGEYDAYVPRLCELLRHRASVDEVFEYLWAVETQAIYLRGNREKTKSFAEWLCALDPTDG